MYLHSLYIHICLSPTCNNVREENCYHYFIDKQKEVQLSGLSKIIISLKSSQSKLWLFKKSHTLPSRKKNIAAAAAKSLQSCLTLCDPKDSSPRGSPIPGILKNTGVGCHFFLKCMKLKSESEVAESCPTLSDPMDCGPPGSSVHGIFQARVLEWGATAFSNHSC